MFHNDYRLDNLLFDAAGGVCILDWQASCRSAAVLDLAMFLAVSLEPDDRRRLEPTLLQIYLDRLHTSGSDVYEQSDLMRDYRVGLLAVWPRIVVPAGSVADLSTARSKLLIDVMTSRLQEALLDHDCASVLD